MLSLKKIQLLGFKSFCDRTDIFLPGQGIAVIVGPNGCGKSNILDAVSWVLGEQSAKSLRGGRMEDVIFAGTRDRKQLGMAEVSITLIDPETYADGPLLAEPEVVIENDPDWDEDKLRAERAAEIEEIIAESQPGQILEGEPNHRPLPSEINAETEHAEGSNAVVLKIRRRKFQRTPRRGEIVLTRRLFRTGESEYLLNGKLCRLRDIQDIFMGTGLGPESYAIIGQERIGQLLSSRPHDRRAIIEEAAGITRFKTKKRLAELRLQQSKQNLARVNDIFEEVTRQLASLKRQAAKAERYGALRDEMRSRLRVVLASKVALMDSEQGAVVSEIQSLSMQVSEHDGHIDSLASEYSAATARGYELESKAKDAQGRASQCAVELERVTARQNSNRERILELQTRAAEATSELEQTMQQLASLAAEKEMQQTFLDTASAESAAFRQQVETKQRQARDAVAAVSASEQSIEAARRQGTQLLSKLGLVCNQTAQAEEALASFEREADRLASEISAAKRDLDALGAERGQLSINFESMTEALKRLESEIASLSDSIRAKRNEEAEAKGRGDQLRAEHATLSGRSSSLKALIREHSYSTDTVRKLFRSNSLGRGLAPVGTLADFLEVNDQYESVVDEFLRDELNYIVVKSWDAANEGMRLLKTDVDGRATFLVHPEDAQARFSFAADNTQASYQHQQGIVRLKECIRVLDGFGSSLEVILPKLREGYVTPDSETARSLALENPHAFFLAPSGECFHNVTVTGGKPRAEGPLAIKRELRDIQQKLEAVERELGLCDVAAATLSKELGELTGYLEAKSEDRRVAERESANQSAALRQMESEVQRLDRRIQEWTLQSDRNKDLRAAKQQLIEQMREQAKSLESQHEITEASLMEIQRSIEELRAMREEAQEQVAAVSAELAGLEERRRGAESAFARINRMHVDLTQRVSHLEQQVASSVAEQQQRVIENEQLAGRSEELTLLREEILLEIGELTKAATDLRTVLADIDLNLRALRAEADNLRDARSERSARAATLAADIAHVEEACLNDLGTEAAAVRADSGIQRLADEMLAAEDEACRALKQKMESMGPVNMMALEEYRETQQRYEFLETQRKDLLQSIENTQATIKEIDLISRAKFDEAFVRINENFGITFSRLFGGGQAFMRLTDEENSSDSGVDIVSQPPGKKLQNVLLLSGGEKALTALSLLVGIFQYQPSPFCVLDEVDAPLDETNVGRLADLLQSMSADTQFVMVTHSKRMMTSADLIYGVTMQEPGVSKMVSVRIGGYEKGFESRRATA